LARFLSVTIFFAHAAAQAAPAQDAGLPGGWVVRPSALGDVDERIRQQARAVSATEPPQRSAFWDAAYPATAAEYDSVAGNALLLVSALAHDSVNFPVSSIYLQSGGRLYELQMIRSVLSRRSKKDDVIARSFGRYREDVICLLPMAINRDGARIVVMFNGEGTAAAGAMSAVLPGPVAALLKAPPTRTVPSMQALADMIAREYPGLLDE
jgi:hypothetical protein